MLKTLNEIKDAEMLDPGVVNGIDNPNLDSVDSTEPISSDGDNLTDDGKVAEGEVKKEEKNEEKKTEKKVEEGVKAVKEKKEESSKPSEELDVNESDSKTVQKRIGKLTKKWRTAERERDLKEEKIAKLEAELQKATAKIPDVSKPLKVDFEDEDDFIEALAEWKVDAKLKTIQKGGEKKDEEKATKKDVEESYDGLDDAMDRGKEKYTDFDDLVLDDTLIISSEVTRILLDTESPEDVLYYLASNPEKSEKICNLSLVKAAREIGKIEVSLGKVEAEPKAEPKPKPNKKQSKAPAPISPVRTDGVVDKDPDQMSPKEYKAWRESKK